MNDLQRVITGELCPSCVDWLLLCIRYILLLFLLVMSLIFYVVANSLRRLCFSFPIMNVSLCCAFAVRAFFFRLIPFNFVNSTYRLYFHCIFSTQMLKKNLSSLGNYIFLFHTYLTLFLPSFPSKSQQIT